jgi:hypothetical protein
MPEAAQRFGFRWRRAGAAALGLMTLGLLILAGAVAAAAWLDGKFTAALVALPLLLAAAFTAAMAAKLPAAVVCPTALGLAVDFPVALSSVIPWGEIEAAAVAHHPWWHGLGIRLIGAGGVALATAPGPAAELVLRHPQRVTIIPPVARVRARRLRLTVDDPAGLVETVTSRSFP